jgi:hypothetical protein
MKTFFATLAAALMTASTALADEAHEHPAGSGLFGLSPEYVHVLLNPLPVYGAAIGVLVLGIALLARSKPAQLAGLWVVILSTALVWPVAHYGQNAYKGIREKADEPGQGWLDEHMERAERTAYVFYGTAVLGLVALVARKKFPKAATPLTIVTLVAGMVSLGAGGWISKAGGQIRHPEFRGGHGGHGESSTNAAPHEHGATEKSHDKMQHSDASGEHKHGTTSEQPAQKTPLPDTLEGVWKAIHEHHGELASSVNTNQFKEVQSHAGMINDLVKRLVEIAPADRKAIVESGANKMNHALDELKKSAETGSELVMKNNFKEFEKSLNELEQQMKEQ